MKVTRNGGTATTDSREQKIKNQMLSCVLAFLVVLCSLEVFIKGEFMLNNLNQFTNKYSLSKTLRFELRPQFETQAKLEESI